MKKFFATMLAICTCTLLSAQNIVQGEYFFDIKKEYGMGTQFTMPTPDDDLTIETALPVANLQEGLHRLFVRFRDSGGRWGQTLSFPVLIKREEVVHIVAGEYFFDEVGDYGTGDSLTPQLPSPMAEVVQALPVADLPDGLHRLFVRFRDSNGLWSETISFHVLVKHAKLVVIESGEYFFDTNMAYEAGIPFTMDSIDSITSATGDYPMPASLTPGPHTMFYRFKDSEGLWSHTLSQPVCANVVTGKYMTDTTSYCFGDTVFFDYTGSATTNAYNWDLNNDGVFTDWQSNGMPFFYIPTTVENDSAVFRYRITSPLCTFWSCEDSIKVYIAPELLIVESITDASCFGDCNGTINANLIGGSPPFSYQWSNGSTQKNQNSLCSGEFSLTVTDALGCVALDSFFIDEPEPIMVSIDTIGDEVSGQGNGFVEITVNGGTLPYIFDWQANNVQISTNEDPDGLSAGVYVLNILDDNDCFFSIELVVDNVSNTAGIKELDALRVYPNPTSEALNIQVLDGKLLLEVRLYDMLGHIFIAKSSSGATFSFDVGGIPSSTYNLVLISENEAKYVTLVSIIR